MTGPDLPPNPLPLRALREQAAIEQPFIDRLAQLRRGIHPDIVDAIYTLGFWAGAMVTTAEEVARKTAQADIDPPLE